MKRNRNQKDQEGVPISAWILVGVLGVVLAIFRNGPSASANRLSETEILPPRPVATLQAETGDELLPPSQPRLEPQSAHTRTVEVVQPEKDRAKYLLRVGPYQSGRLAEAFKARIALLGYASSIEAFEKDGRTHYRVRLGPFATAELDEVKRRLREGGVNSLSVVRR